MDSNSVQAWNFFFRPVTLICTNAQVVFITAKIAFIFRSQLSAVHIYDFHIFTFKHLFIASRVYLEPTYQPAPSWLISSVGRALHWYCRGHGFKSRTSRLIFTTAQVVFITANIAFIFISKSAVHIYDSYIFTVTTFVLHLWFCFVLLCDWSRKLDLRFQPIRYKNRVPHLGTHFLPVLCVFSNDNWNEKYRGWTQRVKCLCRSGIFNVYAACFQAVRTKLSHTSHKKSNKPIC